MNAVGSAALVAALLVAIYAVVAALIGTRGDRRWVISARRAVYAMFGLLLLTAISLEAAFLRTDLSIALVADHSSTTTPTLYKLTALWGSQAGSLLLWAFVLSAASSAVLFATRNRHREVVPWATAVLAGVAVFFLALMVAGIAFPGAESWPFAAASPIPAEGAGLTPLLRHPAMAIHPPMLYSGYVFFTIPFAFAVGALITRKLDASWIRSTRRFALIAWLFLTVGVALGARWSYSELGWGGYWAWDPVENAALIPWLTGTAFLHSIMVQERRGMLRVWNVSLICATFALSLLGTFLVRSGVLQSIHAFGESKVGPPLLGLIAVVAIGTTVLIVSRLDSLRSERRLDSLFSRESVFLVNNLLLVGMAAVVAWGTFFPLISEAVTGETSSLAAPWFNRYATPIAIVLVFFMGIGPLVAWRRVTLSGLRRALGIPLAATAVAAVVLALTIGISESPTAYALFLGATFTIVAIIQEIVRGAGARRALSGGGRLAALGGLFTRNRRRYGGYVVHVGLVLALFGIAASSSFQTSRDLRLTPGEEAQVGDYTIRYDRPTSEIDPVEQKLSFGAVLLVSRDGRPVTTLHPSREYYSGGAADPSAPLKSFFEGETTSEVGRDESLSRDLWSAMQPDLSSFDPIIAEGDRRYAKQFGPLIDNPDPEVQATLASVQGDLVLALSQRYLNDTPPAEIRFNVNPFVIWFWLGGMVGVGGALFALWPTAEGRRRRVSDVYGARLARELAHH
ncbi:MAG: cytochrome c-type biosis protein CcmF [Solirubrobacterales bacterium]|jgi:cytochrome c-type biogenesis protein CcmF|nr:cytochrome c-type biosis protein CcmF [Solirubrobacterales bacterium]